MSMDIVVLSLILTINMLPDHKQEKRNYTPDNNNHVINNKGDVREGVVRLQRTTVFFSSTKNVVSFVSGRTRSHF